MCLNVIIKPLQRLLEKKRKLKTPVVLGLLLSLLLWIFYGSMVQEWLFLLWFHYLPLVFLLIIINKILFNVSFDFMKCITLTA